MDEFTELAAEAGYTDQKTIVVKFWKGLDPQIQNTITTMAYGYPSDVSPEDWYKVAKNIDQNCASNKAFKMAYRTSAPITTCPAQSSLFQIPSPIVCPNPTLGHPAPMDVGLYQKKNPAPITCYQCGESGHKAPDCPLKFDIRSWSMEEIEMELMARKDLAETESLALKLEENPIPEEVLYSIFH